MAGDVSDGVIKLIELTEVHDEQVKVFQAPILQLSSTYWFDILFVMKSVPKF